MSMEITSRGRWPAALERDVAVGLAGAAYRASGGTGSACLELSFVDDAAMRRLNRQWRGLDRTTDVLSFGQDGFVVAGGVGRRPIRALGDVVIALPTARRQAKAAGRDLLTELAILIVHGVLHLCGHDHATPREEKRMFALQQELLMRAKII